MVETPSTSRRISWLRTNGRTTVVSVTEDVEMSPAQAWHLWAGQNVYGSGHWAAQAAAAQADAIGWPQYHGRSYAPGNGLVSGLFGGSF